MILVKASKHRSYRLREAPKSFVQKLNTAIDWLSRLMLPSPQRSIHLNDKEFELVVMSIRSNFRRFMIIRI